MEHNLEEVFKNVLEGAEGIVKEVMGLTDEDIQQRMKEIEGKVKTMLDKKPEDYTNKEKMAAALHFKVIAPTLPHAQAWLVDVFIMSVGFLIRDQNVDEFGERMERLIDYIIDYRKSFLPDTEENRESVDDAE